MRLQIPLWHEVFTKDLILLTQVGGFFNILLLYYWYQNNRKKIVIKTGFTGWISFSINGVNEGNLAKKALKESFS